MSSSAQPAPQETKKVRDFLAAIPPNSSTIESNVTFDSRRDSNESELCRKVPGGGASCMKVYLSSTALFATIQKLGYLCMAPVDPASTEIHCTRIASGPVAPELDVGKTSNSTPSIA